MRRPKRNVIARLLEYDSARRRVWIAGQRCHHGATGSIVATTAFAALAAERLRAASTPRPLFAVALAGGAMMAHDWKDRSMWFERGRGSV